MPRLPERSCASRGPGPIKRALFGFAISSPCARALRGSSRFSSIPFRTRRKAILPRTIHCDPYRQQPHRNAMARGASGVHADAERSFEGRQGAHRSNSVSAAGSLGLFGWLYRSSSENCGGSVNRHGPAKAAPGSDSPFQPVGDARITTFSPGLSWARTLPLACRWSFQISVFQCRHVCRIAICAHPSTPLCSTTARATTSFYLLILEWGASIPNSSGRAVVVTEAHGVVCWDLKAHGSEGCSGPSRNGPPAGAGFLAEDAPAGALIMGPREEHTWFSVNGRSGAGFKDNQGFYEFDLEIE